MLTKSQLAARPKDQIAHAEMAGKIFPVAIGQRQVEPENDIFGRRIIAAQVSLIQMPSLGKTQVFIADFETADDLAGIGTFDLPVLLSSIRILGGGQGRNPKQCSDKANRRRPRHGGENH